MTSFSENNDAENVREEEANEQDKNENVQVNFLPAICSESQKKRKRIPHRPYASPTNRIVKKSGRYNVFRISIPEKNSRYLKDLGNTLLTIRWRWILLSLCLANAVAYFIFTVLWIAVVMWEESYMSEADRYPCIIGGNSTASYFILVVETITTIGSGEIYPTDCQSGWVIITFQALAGVAIEGALVTAVYFKISRPHEKHSTKIFSKNAVICRRDGVQCLIFRIRDIYGKYRAKTTIKSILIGRKYVGCGELTPYYFQKLHLEEMGLLIWPQEIVHKITKDSPFWKFSKFDLYKIRFEIMVVLEGDSSTTGEPSQCQTSYTNKEILWGYCFSPCIEYDETAQKYVVIENMFNNVVNQEIAECSAQQLHSILNENKMKK